MSEKPYKALGIDLLNAARHDRERAIDAFIGAHHAMEKATLADRDWGVKASRRVRAIVVNEQLGRHLPSLDAAIQENGRILGETLRAREVQQHLRALRAEAVKLTRSARHSPGRSVRPASAPAVMPPPTEMARHRGSLPRRRSSVSALNFCCGRWTASAWQMR